MLSAVRLLSLLVVGLLAGSCGDRSSDPAATGPGTVRFSASAYVVDEDAGAATVTLLRVGGSEGPLTVFLYCDLDTAQVGVDVASCDDAIVSWEDGETAAKPYSISVIDDTETTGHKSLRWSVFALEAGVIVEPDTAFMVIREDEGNLPRVAFTRAMPDWHAFGQPVFVAEAPGDPDLLYVVEQIGRVSCYDRAANTLHVACLELDERVQSGGEAGLLGLAFDPDFASNGHVYVNYTTGPPLTTRISRFTMTSPTELDLDSEAVLLSYAQPFSNHNGGWLGFGPDGKLYIASGDGGDANDPQNHGQRLDTLLGKILRINPDGTVPADNPFADDGDDATLAPIWAYGLRNPWRGSFDRDTGDLWIGDVGQGAREEIDLIVAGGNYGWKPCEGSVCGGAPPAGHVAPVIEYTHASVGGSASVTGGYRYRGPGVPAADGLYFYADFIGGQVWALQYDGAVQANHRIATIAFPSSFAEGLDGELYLVSYTGSLYRMVGF